MTPAETAAISDVGFVDVRDNAFLHPFLYLIGGSAELKNFINKTAQSLEEASLL